MGSRQLPFELFDYSYYDLTDREMNSLTTLQRSMTLTSRRSLTKPIKAEAQRGLRSLLSLPKSLRSRKTSYQTETSQTNYSLIPSIGFVVALSIKPRYLPIIPIPI